jgi:glycosyltransferase involved in cell wall biosynthesis
MHEIMPEFFMSKFKVPVRHPVVRVLLFLERISLKFADEVITINEPIKNIFQARAIPGKPITVVMNTISGWDSDGRKRRHKGFNCVYHGTVTDLYGLDAAIEGFSEACRQCGDMNFHIFGGGPQVAQLKRMTKDLKIEARVIFHGEMLHSQLIDSLGEMDLGILAIRKDIFLNLSFSNKLAEYVYLRIPVISSDLDATKYYFTGEDILYFEAGNSRDLSEKIVFAYMNRGQIQKMAESAYEKARAFGWEIMAERYLNVVEGNGGYKKEYKAKQNRG